MKKVFLIVAMILGLGLIAGALHADDGRVDSMDDSLFFPKCCTDPKPKADVQVVDCLVCDERLNYTGETNKRCIRH